MLLYSPKDLTVEKLGRWLREAREAKGSTLEEVEAVTHIRVQFLQLLEAGDFAAFPGGAVQVRGFLRIYARYLEVPTEEVLGRYSTGVQDSEPLALQATPPEVQPEPSDSPDDLTSIQFRPRDIPVSSSLPRWMSVETVLILGVVLTLLLGVLAVATYLINRPEGEPSPASLIMTTSTVVSPPTVSPTETNPSPTATINTTGEVTLSLEATEHVQTRVKCGSEIVFEDMMVPGQTKHWSDDEIIVVETGNGAGLYVSVNGGPKEAMCERGELCTRAWSPSSEVSPP